MQRGNMQISGILARIGSAIGPIRPAERPICPPARTARDASTARPDRYRL